MWRIIFTFTLEFRLYTTSTPSIDPYSSDFGDSGRSSHAHSRILAGIGETFDTCKDGRIDGPAVEVVIHPPTTGPSYSFFHGPLPIPTLGINSYYGYSIYDYQNRNWPGSAKAGIILHRVASQPLLLSAAIVFEVMNRTAAEMRYVVDSPNCRIPDFDPYDKSIAGLISKWPPFTCSSLPPLTTVTRNYKGGQGMHFSHTLHLHHHLFRRYHMPQDNFRCCYKLVTRITTLIERGVHRPDDGFKASDCIDFSDNFTFDGSEEFIWVRCKGPKAANISKPPMYVNMHAFIGNKNEALRKMNAYKQSKRELSVMIVGIDSMSRLNMIRTLPKTVKYLTQFGWYNMKGFNKMDDNTFPNVMATLSGTRNRPTADSCEPWLTTLDECPIIWKDFSDKGYITAYGEDEPYLGTFNHMKKGFYKTPTDYYMRPFILAGFWNTTCKHLGKRNSCFGPTKVADHIFNYALDFSISFLGYPTFSLFWQNGFSHDDLNTASAMDDTVLSFFRKLATSGVMNTTMILFLSDHGMRVGKIRQTFLGYLEERLPFFYFWVPEWFKKAHPDRIKNLASNSNRLISHFDVYMTLVDILGKKLTAPGCPKCTSLFNLVPWNRSCIDAGIRDHWCTCAEYTDIHKTHPLAMRIARLVVNDINKLLNRYAGYVTKGTRCAKLRSKKVISLKKKMSSDLSTGSSQMIVVVKTTPGMGLFEATVSYEGGLRVMDGISRINTYGNQSKCVQHYVAQKYCYCTKSK